MNRESLRRRCLEVVDSLENHDRFPSPGEGLAYAAIILELLDRIERVECGEMWFRLEAERSASEAKDIRDALDCLREIGLMIGRDRCETPEDRAGLVRCVREAIEGRRPLCLTIDPSET